MACSTSRTAPFGPLLAASSRQHTSWATEHSHPLCAAAVWSSQCTHGPVCGPSAPPFHPQYTSSTAQQGWADGVAGIAALCLLPCALSQAHACCRCATSLSKKQEVASVGGGCLLALASAGCKSHATNAWLIFHTSFPHHMCIARRARPPAPRLACFACCATASPHPPCSMTPVFERVALLFHSTPVHLDATRNEPVKCMRLLSPTHPIQPN